MIQEYRWMGERQAMLLSVLRATPQTVRELQAELDRVYSLQLFPRQVLSLLDGLHNRGLVDLLDWDSGPAYHLQPAAAAAQAAACARFQATPETEEKPANSPVKRAEGLHGTVTASGGISEVR